MLRRLLCGPEFAAGRALLLMMAGLAVCGRVAQGSGTRGGVVIYKDFSFDPDSAAELARYSSCEHFDVVDNVETADGRTLRLLSGQTPIYFPLPGDPEDNAGDVIRRIVAAERRFPQFTRELESVRRGWLAMPVRAIAGATPRASPPPPVAAAPDPTGAAGNVLRTSSGEVFRSWKVTGMDGDAVIISHEDGISRVAISDLPDNLYGFPPEVIARVRQLRRNEAGADGSAGPGGSPGQGR